MSGGGGAYSIKLMLNLRGRSLFNQSKAQSVGEVFIQSKLSGKTSINLEEIKAWQKLHQA